jgi:hypothetical protein
MDATTVIANDINTPLLNASNISVDEDITCEQLVCADVICNDVTTNFLFDVDLTNNLSAGPGYHHRECERRTSHILDDRYQRPI